MSGWTHEPPEVVRVRRERDLEGTELEREADRLAAILGWRPAAIRKRLVIQDNGRHAMEWDLSSRTTNRSPTER